jgi:hypothetical protein
VGRSRGPSRPSPAIVVASLALIAALAGPAIAGPDATTSAVSEMKVKKIARKQINKLVPGLARKQVKKLAPGLSVAHADSAASANTATTAADALQVNGVSVVKIDFRRPEGAPEVTILDLAGLQLRASCPATGGVRVLATTTKQNSSLYGYADYPPNIDYDSFRREGGDFDIGTIVDLEVEFDGLGDPRVGALVYEAPDGGVVTVQFSADVNGTSHCVFTGTAVGV